MSKIDLSKAKLGDKFRTRGGYVVAFKDMVRYMGDDVYRLISPKASVGVFQNGKMYKDNKASEYDLVEQVFDDEKGRAITDKILKDAEKVVNGVAEAMPLIEIAAIANLPREPLPENNEDDAELQRRQEIVQLAEKLVTNELFAVTNHIHDMRELGAAINLDSPTEYAFLIAEEFVSTREKYLKEGKL